mmetsp:Transcript_32863/g.59624  ORF Transcript_32863/g.59624 Transcript_32863/m.59624 type:complete len:394 (-) Transcript_32863:67-1248(-)
MAAGPLQEKGTIWKDASCQTAPSGSSDDILSDAETCRCSSACSSPRILPLANADCQESGALFQVERSLMHAGIWAVLNYQIRPKDATAEALALNPLARLVRDARACGPEPCHNVLDARGFMLVEHETRVQDFDNLAEVQQVFYKEVEELCQAYLTGVEKCIVFDHKCRKGGRAGCWSQQLQTRGFEPTTPQVGLPPMEITGYGGIRKPFDVVHGDYTKIDAWRRLRALATVPSWEKACDFAPQLSSNDVEDITANKNFMIVNVWRNTDRENAVKRFPLACLDCRTVHDDEVFDWVPPEGRYRVCDGFADQPDNYVPTKQCLEAMDRHEWFYYPGMTYSEALMFKTFDSTDRQGTARACFHTAFTHPATKPDDPDRQSCEVRVLVIMSKTGETK